MKNKVGIVMLSYNRADVVCECLNSIIQAKNTMAKFELFLLDNGSGKDEYNLIKKEFGDILKNNHDFVGKLVRLEYNSGFPAGNNLGIKHFIKDESISHICLLNSDVIVTDYWLDRLLETNEDAVGPVTNACGNEQTIAVPITAQIGRNDFNLVNEFAHQRKALFDKYKVYTKFLGFFCFVGSKKLFKDIGYLDEVFGRGAYEDDDFCLRVIAKGYKLAIHRGVFIYHFGSASFSQVPLKLLLNHLDNNRLIFENKHKITWKNRDMLPFLGFKQDMNFLFENNIPIDKIQQVFDAYSANIELLLQNMYNKCRSVVEKKSLISRILKKFSLT